MALKSCPSPGPRIPDVPAPTWFWVTRNWNASFISFWQGGEPPTENNGMFWREGVKHPREFPFIVQVDIFVKMFGWELLAGECRRVECMAKSLEEA